MKVSLLNYGAITQGWWINDTPLILGYDKPQDYLTDPFYLGAIVGRVANRMGGAQFKLGDVQYALSANEGSNTLHGGVAGLSRQHWSLEQISSVEAVLNYTSPDGENGFPGEVRFEVRVYLSFPRLTYSISAQVDRPTPISVAQHNYYSLGSDRNVSDNCLKLASNGFLDIDNQGIPSGLVRGVRENGLDFISSKPIGDTAMDIDHYFVFAPNRDHQRPVAEVGAPSGFKLSVYSDQPGAQVYTAAHLSDPFQSGAGLCIEPSGYPNAPNISSFPAIICSPDNPYHQTLILEISGGHA
ncbi:galactose mutarotase [Rhodobacteraceae bacterium B1Z28]|uniref:Galactose mutarotase n=2 Tax=Ruegeria haliotis TaxID=2747601 RepID=A0ABX2PLR1_9RHOB|nr:galactose mutarotase [Ruegeria haliotis]